MLYLYPDTNIFLHFQDFEELDWSSLVDSQEPFTIVMTPVVLDEIDQHKYSSNRKRAHKARNLAPRIDKILDGSQSSIVTVLRSPRSATFNDLNDLGLDSSRGDNWLIATILSDRQAFQPQDTSILITNDAGPKWKAIDYGIRVIRPSENLQLSNEPDETERERDQIKKELNEIKNAQPKLELTFENESALLEIQRPGAVRSRDEALTEKLTEIRSKFPPIIHTPDVTAEEANTYSIRTLLEQHSRLSEEQVNKYNKELENFHSKTRAYWDAAYTAKVFEHHTFTIELILHNKGGKPAENIDLYLHFPDGFEMPEEKGFPKIPSKPSPPYLPKNRLDFGPLNLQLPMLSGLHSNVADHITHAFNGPTIRKTNSYEVTFAIADLKHNEKDQLSPLYLHFADMNKAQNFSVYYRITVGNLTKPVTGKLHVKFLDDQKKD